MCRMPFGLPVEPRGVEDEERMLAVERLGGAVGARRRPSARATRGRGRASSSTGWLQRLKTMHFSTVGDLARAASTFALSGTTLPRRQPPSAVMTSLALASLLRSATASAREAAEDDRVRRADAGAGEHGDRHLGHHRHVDRDAVARLDAERLQDVGELAHLAVQLLVASASRVSPGSPSQMMAALFLRGRARCRSRQL